MKYCVLTSGSKGNCTYIEINNKKYLIDAGTNFLYISNKLKEIDIDIKDIEGIFITHCHDDHTSALKRIIKIVNPIIYITEKTKKELIKTLHEKMWELYNNFDVEEETYLMLEAKRNGFQGVPEVVDLVHNEEYKKNALKKFSDKLRDLL